MWEVAIKTMYIPWGSLALPKPQAFLGTKFTASSLPKEEGWRLTLRGSWIVGHLPSVSGYRQHSDHWLVAEVLDYESWSPRFYSTNIPPSEIVSPLDTGFPTFPRFCSTFPNFFYLVGFSMRMISSADCLPVYHYNCQTCILFTQIIDVSTVVRLGSTFVQYWIRPFCKSIRYDRISKRANVKNQMSDIFFRWDSLFDHDNGDSSIIIISLLKFNGSIFGNAIIVRLRQNSIHWLTI